jgi:anti-sigma B factor antagonist
MRLVRRLVNGCAVVGLVENAEIDVGNCAEFCRSFEEQLEETDRQVIFDGCAADFFDSAGMGSLLSLRKHLTERGGELIVAGLTRSVAEIFRMVGFDTVFRIYTDLDEAISSESVEIGT